jgi:hypothetical protein
MLVPLSNCKFVPYIIVALLFSLHIVVIYFPYIIPFLDEVGTLLFPCNKTFSLAWYTLSLLYQLLYHLRIEKTLHKCINLAILWYVQDCEKHGTQT